MVQASKRKPSNSNITMHRNLSQPTVDYKNAYIEKFHNPNFEVRGSRDFQEDIMQRQRTNFSLQNKNKDIENATGNKTVKNTDTEDAKALEILRKENLKNEMDKLHKEEKFNKRERTAKVGLRLLTLIITVVGTALKVSTWRKILSDIPGTAKDVIETIKTIVKCFAGKEVEDDESSCTEIAVKAVVPIILLFVIIILFLNYMRP